MSRPSLTDEWLTPRPILEALGPFDLDPCASVVRPWPTAARHYTIADNGLALPWFGRVWLNPPYRKCIGAWLGRMVAHGRGTALVFAKTDTRWFFDHVWRAASGALFLEGRLQFHYIDGTTTGDARRSSVLIAYGHEDFDRLAESGISGALVPLTGGGQMVAVLRPASDLHFAPSIEGSKCKAAPDQTWRDLLAAIARDAGAPLPLALAYVLVGDHPKARGNRHWREKVRQTLQGAPFRRIASATYALELGGAG
jgi:hypothetical protein